MTLDIKFRVDAGLLFIEGVAVALVVSVGPLGVADSVVESFGALHSLGALVADTEVVVKRLTNSFDEHVLAASGSDAPGVVVPDSVVEEREPGRERAHLFSQEECGRVLVALRLIVHLLEHRLVVYAMSA